MESHKSALSALCFLWYGTKWQAGRPTRLLIPFVAMIFCPYFSLCTSRPPTELSWSSQFLNLQSLALHDGQLLWLCPWGRQVLSSPCASVESVSWGLSFLLCSALLPLAKVSAQTKQAFKAWSLFPLLSILHCSLFGFFSWELLFLLLS